jgi:hypothetical protein
MNKAPRQTEVFPEYLGDIATEALLQNLTNVNPHFSSIDWIRESVPQGFTADGEFELKVYEQTEEGRAEAPVDLRAPCKPGDLSSLHQKEKKLVRIVLEAKAK